MLIDLVRRGTGFAVALGLAVSTSAGAQQRVLTLDEIYDPDRRASFGSSPPPPIAWIDGTRYAIGRSRAGAGVDWMDVDAETGTQKPLFDAARMEAALVAHAGASDAEARRLSHERSLVFNRAHTSAILPVSDDLWVHRFTDGGIVRLTRAPGAEDHPTFSPDGRLVAFVRANNLYVADVRTGRETALTTDGAPRILNGRLDWVYEEEIYGRGQNRAYWWSPDSTRIAFLRIDDSPVPIFTTVDEIPYEQIVERWDYPKAGDPNPLVKVGIARVRGGSPTWVDTSKYEPGGHLIVRVGWAPDGRSLVYEAQNRTQTWLELNLADASSGRTRTILRETSRYWIASDDATLPTWLRDGSFLWLSDRSGWRHLYRYRRDGTPVGQLTDGKWELRTLHGVDAAEEWAYFSGTERSHIGSDVYRIRIDGTGLRRLSAAEGTHAAEFSPTFAYYVDSHSTATTPRRTRLHERDGREVRVIDESPAEALREYRLSTPEFLQVRARDGFVMEAMLIKPPDFDATRRYPVYQFTYGGPHTPQVRNAWGGTQYLFHQLLAQHGIIVWVCDNRTASGKGSESVWALHRSFGDIELRDIEDCLTWLKRQSYVDGSRIGIHGWSYGGYLTSYALTHSKSFVMGIAGGTVADWRDYDSVYTERYMGLPDENPEGYRRSSPRFAAADLHGALMLIHGTLDDNVHLANTMQLVYELQKAQKRFQLMLYPKTRHGVTDPALVKHMGATMLEFVLQHLRPDARD